MIGICFDFETSGLCLHPQARLELQPHAIEFGGVLFNEEGEILQRVSLLIKPPIAISDEITKITGITNEMLADAPKFVEALPEIRAVFAKADAMIAHNLPFDSCILEVELLRIGEENFPWPRHRLCTVQAFMERWGKRPRLGDLYEDVIGRPMMNAHRAADDCAALCEIVVKEELLDDFKGIRS